jgi:hypothetical protein
MEVPFELIKKHLAKHEELADWEENRSLEKTLRVARYARNFIIGYGDGVRESMYRMLMMGEFEAEFIANTLEIELDEVLTLKHLLGLK